MAPARRAEEDRHLYPVITLGAVELSSYAALLAVGGSLGFWLTYREADRAGLDPGPRLALAALAFTAGLIGARASSLLAHHRLYANEPWWSLLAVWDRGGLSLYGGLLLAAAVGLAYIRYARLPAWDAADRLVVAWIPFLFFVRIGCFLNGCCYGRPTTSALGLVAGGPPNAVNFGIPSHPTQLYEAAALLALGALAWWMRGRRRFAGQIALTFVVLHSAVRLVVEPLRGDRPGRWSGSEAAAFTLNQPVAAVLLIGALSAAVWLQRPFAWPRRRSRKANTPASASGSE